MMLKQFCKLVLKPYRRYLMLMVFTGFLWALHVSVAPYLLKMVIDRLSKSKSVAEITWPAVVYVGSYFLVAMNFRWLDWLQYKMFPLFKKNTAMQMFSYLKYHSHEFYQNHFAGSISNKVNDMVTNLESLVRTGDELVASVIALCFALIVMYTVNPFFALILFVWWIAFFVISFLFSRYIHQYAKSTSEAYSKYSGHLVDILGNMSSVRLFSRYRHETSTLESTVDNLVENDKKMLQFIIKMRLTQDATITILIGFMFYLLVRLYSSHQVTIGDFSLILMITMTMFTSMWSLANKIVDTYRSIGRCVQAINIIEKDYDVTDKSDAGLLKVSSGSVCFKHVNFSYDNSSPLFSNKNVTIEAGTKVGLVGYSGSGKSTFINLMLRLYDIQSGEILIDGQNIADVTQESLRSQISMIPQDISLFHRSLMENIRYGNVNATEEQVIAASKKAHCHEFIMQMQDGYDTLVGERGIKLSGGQRQRIAIARAFLEDAPILIMDEATSSLDSVTEKYVQTSLHQAIQNRTTIVVAHRLSTLLEMDRILVFDQGKIIEDGSHDDLLLKGGRYHTMWSMQSNGFLPTDQ